MSDVDKYGAPIADDRQRIRSYDVYSALQRMGIDPYGVIEVVINTEMVSVTRQSPTQAPIVTDYPIDRKGLG